MPASDGEDYEDQGYGEASRYAAHLDRGWALLEQGDTASARTSADHAQKARPEDPDAAVLQGAIALAEGHPDESLRCYDHAIELDPDYLEPYAAAAQVCLFDVEDPARAVRYCEDALELEGLSPFETLDLGLMAAECELARGSTVQAGQRLDALAAVGALRLALELGAAQQDQDTPDPDSEGDDDLEIDLHTDRGVALAFLRTDAEGERLEPEEHAERVARAMQFALRLTRLRIDLGHTSLATELSGQLTLWYPRDPDAWYLLSEAAFRDGSPSESSHAALRALDLDGATAMPPWAPNVATVHQRVLAAIGDCPDPEIRLLVQRPAPIAVIVREAPSSELVLEGVDPRLCALTLASRTAGDGDDTGLSTLTGLAVYRRAVVRYARDAEHFEQELRQSVFDELATFLGLDDSRRETLGLPPLPPSVRAAMMSEMSGESGASAAEASAKTEEPQEPTPRRSRRRRRA